MKIDFSKIAGIRDIEGNLIKFDERGTMHKMIGNGIFSKARNFELVDIARDIHAGKEVNLRDSELDEIEALCLSDACFNVSWAKKAAQDFIKKTRLEYKKPKEEDK